MHGWMVLGRGLIGMVWVGWAAYWIIAARHSLTNRRTESLLTGASYRVLLVLGVILLAFPGYHLSSANEEYRRRVKALIPRIV